MQTLDYDHTMHTRPDAGDESLFVQFYAGTMVNTARTEAEGRRIVDDVECVRIIIPGDKNSVIDRPASPQDRARFPKQYAAFKAGKTGDEQISGTRLTDWPTVSRGQAEELAYLGVKTVEQLADLRDDVVSRVPGLVSLKQTARIWLDKAQAGAEAAALEKRLRDQDAQIELLTRVVREQGERLEAQTTAKPTKGERLAA